MIGLEDKVKHNGTYMLYPDEESSTLEFKESFPQNHQIIKTVVAFCNRKGGKVIIGVKDDRTIIGLSEEAIQEALETLDQAIFGSTSPPIIPHIGFQHIGDKIILIIEVSSGMNKPYCVKSEGAEKGTYVRLGQSTLRANSGMIQELQWQSRGRSMDSMPVYHAKEENLDWTLIRQFLNWPEDQQIPKEILCAHHILAEEHGLYYPTTASILLFGKNPQYFFSEAMVIVSHFSGISGREALASIDCIGNLLQQFRDAFHFLTSRLPHSFTIKGAVRKELLELPEEAIREILLNALIHRNYHLPGPSKVSIYDNRMEFFSPGDFTGPVNLKNLRTGLTYIRNPIICTVFRKAKLIEKMGTGFITLLDSFDERGLKSPEVFEGENFVKCILPREKVKIKENALSPELQKILDLFQQVEVVTISDVMNVLKLPRTTSYRKLMELMELGLIERKGEKKGQNTL